MPESSEAPCPEEKRLFMELRDTLGSLIEIQRSHMEALSFAENQMSRFEGEIRVALSAWQDARQTYVRHVLDHGCRSSRDLI